ncbi:hypothetical protein PIB30_002640 [Stylosanthes scabra]|uniref:Glutaredoxin domain-containing protein n=1 Tax=Stylosanthes scabra TaxID=79078 RepID=A0ABU6Q2W7_9FABA|nr:hypothetical protein [Stylosanthes scabra]
MTAMKAMFLSNLKLIPTLTTTNLNQQGLLLQLNPPESSFYDDHNKATMDLVEEEKEKVDTTTAAGGGGEGKKHWIILYTTSMRGIRKTFQDCKRIRFLLRSLLVKFDERDVSLHMEYRDELWNIFGGKVIPPKLFIKGTCVGGADEVLALHEIGSLRNLLEGAPTLTPHDHDFPCVGCNNFRFSICSKCSGSRKISTTHTHHDHDHDDDDFFFVRCPECNENGLVKCTICSTC